MPPDSISPGSSADWLRYAKADLALAQVPLPAGGLYELLCFHAQQAAEKGSALNVMLFLENLMRALLIFNRLRSRHCQRALLGYHYPIVDVRPESSHGTC